MATALRKASRLKPDIRLAQAVSEFEASLNSTQKASFRNERSTACKNPPSAADVMQLTAKIDHEARQKRLSSRCFGPRLTNLLQAVQQFAALGDVVICIGFSTYLEKLSLLFMAAGREAPRHQAMALIYPMSKALQTYLCEYFIVVTHICQRVQSFTQKSMMGQLAASLNDSDLKGFQSDLELWSNSIKQEANLQLNEHFKTEAHLSAETRGMTALWTKSTTRRFDVAKKLKWLDSCSTYDFETTWKQTQKLGLTSLLSSSNDYQEWKKHTTSSSILFSGKIGAGKSVTMANVVSDLNRDKEAVVLYFFCRYDIPESLKHQTILGSLARQYLNYFPIRSEVFADDIHTSKLGVEEFIGFLGLGLIGSAQKYIIVDGLDDCGAEERRIVLQQLTNTQQPSSRWHLGISAQPTADDFVKIHLKPNWNVSLPAENPDIEFFIDVEMEARLDNGDLAVGDPALIADIKKALLKGANGMFLWVALQLDAICSEASDYDIKEAIKSLPRDLTATYTRILEKSTARDHERYHKRIFKFLAAAYKPLTSAQIGEMASVTLGDETYDPSRRINNIDKVLGFCGSLIMVDEEEKTVRFVHHSAKSFCQISVDRTSLWQFTNEEAHNELGGTILTYLNYAIFETQLSTNVVPIFDAGKISTGILRQTFHNSWSPIRLAENFVRAKTAPSRQIGHVIAQNIRQLNTIASDHPFLPYAEEFWLLHTRFTVIPSTRHLWDVLVNKFDLPSLPTLPFVATAWAHIIVPPELKNYPGLFWSVQNSHVPMFNHVMKICHDNRSLRFQSLRLISFLKVFRALSTIPIIERFHATSVSLGIESHMATRLLSMSECFKTHKVSEWLASQIEMSACDYDNPAGSGTLNANHITKLDLFSQVNKQPRVAELDAVDTQVAVVKGFTFGLHADTPRTYKLLPQQLESQPCRSPIVRDGHTLLSMLQSNQTQEMLLRNIYSFIQKGHSMKGLGILPAYSVLKMLAESQELNRTLADQTMMEMIHTPSLGFGVRIEVFRRACLMGNLSLATWPPILNINSDQHKTATLAPNPSKAAPRADEISMALQTISSQRFELASRLLAMGASPNGCDASGCPVLHRAVLLRNWPLATSLVNHGASTQELDRFCFRKELFHFCIMHSDLDGVKFLARSGCLTTLNALSTGPEFAQFTPMEVAIFEKSDWCRNYSIGDLIIEGARFEFVAASGPLRRIEERLEMLILNRGRETGPYVAECMQTLEGELDAASSSFKVSSKIICLVAITTRKFVLSYLFDLPKHFSIWPFALEQFHSDMDPVLGYMDNSLLLVDRFFKQPLAPEFQVTDLVLALREMMGALSRLKTADFDDLQESPDLQRQIDLLLPVWKVQMRVLQIVNLLLRSIIAMPSKHRSRETSIMPGINILCNDLLHTSIAGKPTALPQDKSLTGSIFAQQFEHFQNVLEEAFYEMDLPFFLQCSLILGAKFPPKTLVYFASSLDVTYLTDSWDLSGPSPPQNSVTIRKELRSMGCDDETLDTLEKVVHDMLFK
ncbi:hypothetical protein CPAR01_09547 [Colletotrichum paranaense]|uniref:NACHT domain-containing protein n=1 Tax=Colletotrichum paranaense TaxID=1914294 RepID=A0ABQ9SH25_9PEZI|nr:uncharacterized protein CPAR01_09547 [Colletotrichum paranaense]KAK1536005.1 hypothetical protein CPAR01_09547 [Colletotrichum paranaense]